MKPTETGLKSLRTYFQYFYFLKKINDSMKQLEKKCVQLQAVNEKLEPFKYHCPSMLRLLLEFGKHSLHIFVHHYFNSVAGS